MRGKALTPEEVDLFFRLRPRSRRAFMAALGGSAAALSFSKDAAAQWRSSRARSQPRIMVDGSESNNLEFFNWDTYIGEWTLDDFKSSTGINVNMTLFASSDELFTRIIRGNPGFDVIMPSNEFIPRLINAHAIMPLNHRKIPNKINLMPEFQDASFDAGRRYSMPYTWLVLGIGYRKSALKRGIIPDSWRYVFDSAQYKGRISLLSESEDLFRLGLKYLGHSINDATPQLIKKVEALLIKQLPNVKNFHNDEGDGLLLSKEVDLVIEYNGDIAQKQLEDDDIGFVVPKEGSLIMSDCMCIPVGAPNPNNAHAFINFLLDGQKGADIAKTILYPTPNAAAKALMDSRYKVRHCSRPRRQWQSANMENIKAWT
jgi:spermidine/putrescine transport system substrate-binding protein